MPTPISAALGTERQFTPQPEHGYVGQYVGVSPVNVSASTAHYDQLAQNLAQPSQAIVCLMSGIFPRQVTSTASA